MAWPIQSKKQTLLDLANDRPSRSRGLGTWNFSCRLGQPRFKTCWAELCVIARNECSLADFRARIKRIWVSNDFAGIFECGQTPPNQVINAKLFRSPYFHDAIYRRAYRNTGYATRDIVGSHRLEKHMWQTHFAVHDGNVGEALKELEELRRMHDGIRN